MFNLRKRFQDAVQNVARRDLISGLDVDENQARNLVASGRVAYTMQADGREDAQRLQVKKDEEKREEIMLSAAQATQKHIAELDQQIRQRFEEERRRIQKERDRIEHEHQKLDGQHDRINYNSLRVREGDRLMELIERVQGDPKRLNERDKADILKYFQEAGVAMRPGMTMAQMIDEIRKIQSPCAEENKKFNEDWDRLNKDRAINEHAQTELEKKIAEFEAADKLPDEQREKKLEAIAAAMSYKDVNKVVGKLDETHDDLKKDLSKIADQKSDPKP